MECEKVTSWAFMEVPYYIPSGRKGAGTGLVPTESAFECAVYVV